MHNKMRTLYEAFRYRAGGFTAEIIVHMLKVLISLMHHLIAVCGFRLFGVFFFHFISAHFGHLNRSLARRHAIGRQFFMLPLPFSIDDESEKRAKHIMVSPINASVLLCALSLFVIVRCICAIVFTIHTKPTPISFK